MGEGGRGSAVAPYRVVLKVSIAIPLSRLLSCPSGYRIILKSARNDKGGAGAPS